MGVQMANLVVKIDDELMRQIDEAIRRIPFPNRTAFVRAAIRHFLSEMDGNRWLEDKDSLILREVFRYVWRRRRPILRRLERLGVRHPAQLLSTLKRFADMLAIRGVDTCFKSEVRKN